MLFLLACPSDPNVESAVAADSGDTAENAGDTGEPCDWDSPSRATLAADEACATGVSALDLFSFALGSFADTLAWDDGTGADLALATTAGDATEISYGDPSVCMVSLELAVAWVLDTSDGRLGLAEEVTWMAEDAVAGQDLGSVGFDAELDPADVGFTQLDASSTLTFRGLLRTSGELSISVRERWALDAKTTRECVRASVVEDEIGCDDFVDGTKKE